METEIVNNCKLLTDNFYYFVIKLLTMQMLSSHNILTIRYIQHKYTLLKLLFNFT